MIKKDEKSFVEAMQGKVNRVERLFTYEAERLLEHIATLTAENERLERENTAQRQTKARLQATVDKLPKYEDTEGTFVHGRDPAWALLKNGATLDSSQANIGWDGVGSWMIDFDSGEWHTVQGFYSTHEAAEQAAQRDRGAT